MVYLQVTLAKLHHDEQMKPVLPKSVRDDLEAGFSSLEYQVIEKTIQRHLP